MYLKIRTGKTAEFKAGGAPAFVERARAGLGCMHFAVSFNDDEAHGREGYDSAAALLAHLDNRGPFGMRHSGFPTSVASECMVLRQTWTNCAHH
jgi:hypothetical protein